MDFASGIRPKNNDSFSASKTCLIIFQSRRTQPLTNSTDQNDERWNLRWFHESKLLFEETDSFATHCHAHITLSMEICLRSHVRGKGY